MGTLFRSEEMALCQLFIQPEAAYYSVSVLGEAGAVRFRDLNPEASVFQRKFVDWVKRCDEMERKIVYMEEEVVKDDIAVPEVDGSDLPPAPDPREMKELETQLEKLETEVVELSQHSRNLHLVHQELTELKLVLEKTSPFFAEEAHRRQSRADGSGVPLEDLQQRHVSFITGIIRKERVLAFERMLWRLSRGNVFLRMVDLPLPMKDPVTGKEEYKTVFVVFFQGEQLQTRVKKVCAGFRAAVYTTPQSATERDNMLKGVNTRIEDMHKVLNTSEVHRRAMLQLVAKDLRRWLVMVRKAKAIYHAMNMFSMDVTQKCYIAECWVPVVFLPDVQKALEDGGRVSGSSVQSFLNVIDTHETPPTYNRTNKFTNGFQELISAYGVANYREANPALYTIVTFPFLFAVMFGDAGHGIIMLLFGLYMVLDERRHMKSRSKNEVWNIFFGGRYIILMMGCFSIYTGLIYNDVFAISMNIFGSSWRANYDWNTTHVNDYLTLDPAKSSYLQYPYPFGLDPVWQTASNKIIFLNSFKMKLSIILGVAHMIFGVVMSIVNYVHFKTPIRILLEFVPQLLFLVMLFGYMVLLIFIKWIMYGPQNSLVTGPGCAPSILILFINMMLMGHTTPLEGCKEYMFEGQETMQNLLVVVAVLCIPLMLLGMPIHHLCTRKASRHSDDDSSEEEEPFSEIMIHQAIHTVEYVLSTISHTASYLRLWALSLAHAQLSEILWTKIMNMGMTIGGLYVGGVMIFIIFGVWAFFTVSILVMMEGLSAFLHTLRLHWVEFMSKFYAGEGYLFIPFSFKTILSEAEEES
ncbi:V-type proton ATPase 116 kDa subunit a 1-like [Bacillus rossius redtenbacheri]|uniref:V-type proton ATPase 116 kDa subunit a 1-like n=1 Tax=Bacillus rossius redtenbacheri TaxID=93214 RepID=UPI002FDD8246